MIDSIRLENTLLAACVDVIEIEAPCDRNHLADSACEVGLAHWTHALLLLKLKVNPYVLLMITVANYHPIHDSELPNEGIK